MEKYGKLIILAVILWLAIGSETTGANGQNLLCGMTPEGLRACLPAVTANNPSPPTQDCCKALKNANFQCFCVFKNNDVLKRYKIDFNQAMKLPGKCNMNNSARC